MGLSKFYVNNIINTPIELQIDLEETEYDYSMCALHERVIIAFKTKKIGNRFDKITVFNIIHTKKQQEPITILKEEYNYPNLPLDDINNWKHYIIINYNVEHSENKNKCDIDYLNKEYVNKQDNIYLFFDLTNEQKLQLLKQDLKNINLKTQKTKIENNNCVKEEIKVEKINIGKPHIENVEILAITPYIEYQYYIGGINETPINIEVKPCSTEKLHFTALSRGEFTIVGKFYQIEEQKYKILDAIHIKKNPTQQNINNIDYKYELGIGNNLPTDNIFKQWNEEITNNHSTNYETILSSINNQCKKTAIKYYTEPKINNTYSSKWKENTNTISNIDLEQEIKIVINEIEHKHKLIDLITGKVEIEGYNKDYFDIDVKYIKLINNEQENKCTLGENENITNKKVRIFKLYRKEDLIENNVVKEKKRLPENIKVHAIDVVDTGREQYRIIARSEGELNYRLRQYE